MRSILRFDFAVRKARFAKLRRLTRWQTQTAMAPEVLEQRTLLSNITADLFVASPAADGTTLQVQHFAETQAETVRQWPQRFLGDSVLQSGSADRMFAADDYLPVEPGVIYGLSGWAKAGDEFGLRFDPSNQQSFGIEAYDTNRQLIGSLSTVALDHGTVPADFTFRQYTATFSSDASPHHQLPAGTAFIRPVITVNQQGRGGFITWRDVTVRALPGDSPVNGMQQPVIDLTTDTPENQTIVLNTSLTAEVLTFLPSEQKLLVDPALTYTIQADLLNYQEYIAEPLGYQALDADGLLIHSLHVTRFASAADTVLTEAVVPGATSIYVQDASGWSNRIGESAETRSLAWYGYTDGHGTVYPDYSYTRNIAFDFDHGMWNPEDISFDSGSGAWKIDLRQPWTGDVIAAGTAIRNATGHDVRQVLSIPTDRQFRGGWTTRDDEIDWFRYAANVGGGVWQNGQPSQRLFPPGTAAIQPTIQGILRQDNAFLFGPAGDVAQANDSAPVAPTPAEFNSSPHVLLDRSLQSVAADRLIPVETAESYNFTLQAATGTVLGGSLTPQEEHSVGYLAYDTDALPIEAQHVTRFSGSVDTTLAIDLKPGDTSFVLTDATGWSRLGLPETRSLAWYDYMDGTSHVWPDYSYTRNVAFDVLNGLWDQAAITGNVVTLRQPWSGPLLTAGTAVRNAVGGSAVIPAVLNHQSVPNQWTDFSTTISGEWQNGQPSMTQFPPGTAFVRPAIVANQSSFTADDVLQVRNVRLESATATGGSSGTLTGGQANIILDVLANDGADVPDLQIVSVSAPVLGGSMIIEHGSGPNGRDVLRYTSPLNFVGTDFVTYTVRNTVTTEEWSTTAGFTVTGDNLASNVVVAAAIAAQGQDASANQHPPTPSIVGPLLQQDSHQVEAGTMLIADGVRAPKLTEFSSDADGGLLSVRLVSGTSHGALQVNYDGALVYVPKPGFTGIDSFEYVVFDGLHTERRTGQIVVSPSDDSVTQDRLRRIGLSLFDHHDTYGRFPYDPNQASQYDSNGNPLLSWRVRILPYLGFGNLYYQFHLNEPWDSPHNLSLLPLMPAVFRSPGDAVGTAETRFQLISDPNDVSGRYMLARGSYGRLMIGRVNDILDGKTNTLMVVQSGSDRAVPWTAPRDLEFDPASPVTSFGNIPDGRTNVMFANGRVYRLSPGHLSDAEVVGLVTKAGHEMTDGPTLLRRESELTEQPLTRTGVDTNHWQDAQMRSLALAFHNYHDVYGEFPVADNTNWMDANGFPLLSWRVHLLPFLGYSNLFIEFHLDEPWDSPHNLTLLDRMPDIFRSPGDASTSSQTRFKVFAGPDAPFGENLNTGTYKAIDFGDLRDGSSNTALFVETGADMAVPWTAPMDYDFDLADPLSGLGMTDGRIRLALADGSQ
ncbi:MAG: DUF1559 domain-containing protein [Planctomycetaceae bacterium]